MTHHSLYQLILVAAFVGTSFCGLSAQNLTSTYEVPRSLDDRVTEPNPEATAMRRYSDVPISYASGTAVIDVPLVEASAGELCMALSLSYQTGGVKATDLEGYTGVGWSLRGLGRVSRRVVGLPDERPESGVYVPVREGTRFEELSVGDAEKILGQSIDCQYDIYSYDIPGYSGSFVIDSADRIHMLPAADVTITFTRGELHSNLTPAAGARGPITSFKIRTFEGLYYTFEAMENIEFANNFDPVPAPAINADYSCTVTWNLTKIETPDKTQCATISYAASPEWKRGHHIQIRSYTMTYDDFTNLPTLAGPSTTTSRTGPITTFKNPLYPDSIRLGNTTILFDVSQTKLAPDKGAGTLITGIRLKNAENACVKNVQISYGVDSRKRRVIKNVTVYRDNLPVDFRQFEYVKDATYTTLSESYDAFGYPNNKPVDPANHYSVLDENGKTTAGRSWDQRYVAVDALSKITDIMGSETVFTYEPKTYVYMGAANVNDTVRIGYRIKSISAYSHQGSYKNARNRTRTFLYSDPTLTVDLSEIGMEAWCGLSGSVYDTNPVGATLTNAKGYSLTATMTSSSRTEGMAVENTDILYGKVSEIVNASYIDGPLRTDYIFDLTYARHDKVFGESDSGAATGQPLLGSHQFLPYGKEHMHRMFAQKQMGYYIRQTYGGEPLLKKKIVYEYRDGIHQPYETEERTYRSQSSTDVVLGLHCENLVFRVQEGATPQAHVTRPGDYLDYLYYARSLRVVCDEIRTTRHFPGGKQRTVTAQMKYFDDYHKSINNNSVTIHSYNIPEVIGVNANASMTLNDHMPVATVLTCGGETLSMTNAYVFNLSGYQGGVNYSALNRDGYRSLPVKQVWVVNSSDTLTVSNEYGIFGGVPRLSRQTMNRNRQLPLQSQSFLSYDALGHPLSGIDRNGVQIKWDWDANDCLVKKTVAGTLETTYTHTHLVGCRSITLPSGNKRSYSYTAGRLSEESDRYGNPLRKWYYGLMLPDGFNYVTTMQRAGDGMVTTQEFYDSFGLPHLTVTVNGTGVAGHDLFVARDFDGLGREIRTSLPAPLIKQGTATYSKPFNGYLSDLGSFYSGQNGRPYSDTFYFNTPYATPAKIIPAGVPADSICSTNERLCNVTSVAMLNCRRFSVSKNGQTLNLNGYWADGSLDVVRATDPDGRVILTFSDWRNRVVLERRVISAGVFADTYFVYDAWGNHLAVLTPEFVSGITSAYTSFPFGSSEMLKKHAYVYRYDDMGRLSEKRIPGCEPEVYRYDRFNRLAFTQNGEQRNSGTCTAYFYDKAGRQVAKGICNSMMLPPAAPVDTLDMTVEFTGVSGLKIPGYQTKFQRLSGWNLLEVNYYDSYRYLSLSDFTIPPRTITPNTPLGLLSGHLEAVMMKKQSQSEDDLAENSVLLSVYTYDEEDRLINVTSSTLRKDRFTNTASVYNGAGQPVKETRSILDAAGTALGSEMTQTTYDNLGRPQTVKSTLDNRLVVIVSSRTYDQTGRLVSDASACGTDTYSYDMTSRLTSISTPGFSQTLTYTNSGLLKSRYTDLFDSSFRSSYSYDGMSRLTSVTTVGNVTEVLWGGATQTKSGTMQEAAYTYDRNSNITSMQRRRFAAGNELVAGGGAGLPSFLVDDLALSYSGNQLVKVTDSAPVSYSSGSYDFNDGADLAQEYTYDQCGRLLSDANRGIASIQWNENDRPQSIVLDNGMHIDYAYSASGEKLREQFVEKKKVPGFTWMMSTASALSLPIGGSIIISPRDSITIDHVTEERLWINGFEIVGDSVARINTARGYWAGGAFHRYALDWQGNVGAVIAQNGAVEQRTLYYPYGAPYRSDSPEANPYKFSGKQLELRQGLNMAFHGSRLYFADLGRFATPDIFSDRFHWLSPWTYCAANPLNNTDPSGNKWKDKSDQKRLEKAYRSSLSSYKKIIKDNKDTKSVSNANVAIERITNLLNVMKKMKKSPQIFYIVKTDADQPAHVRQTEEGVAIEGDCYALWAHEFIHVGQALDNGGLDFRADGAMKNPGEDGIEMEFNEIIAYQTQFAIDSQTFPIDGVENVMDINFMTFDYLFKNGDKEFKESYRYFENNYETILNDEQSKKKYEKFL